MNPLQFRGGGIKELKFNLKIEHSLYIYIYITYKNKT